MPLNDNILHPFTVELAVRGINEYKDPSAQHDFDFELSMRPHINEKTVSWDPVAHQMIIRLITDGTDFPNHCGRYG
jgi:hypothetical protein